jgi:hypothetical protein
MSLDDRFRDELRHAAELGQLREDDAFDDVWMKYRSSLIRKGILRQALAVAIILSLFAGVAIVVSWRNDPDHAGVAAGSEHRFRSTATLRVASAATPDSTPSHTLTLKNPRRLALAPTTRRAALLAARLSPDDSSVDFRATLNRTEDVLSLTVTAPTATESSAVAHEWASSFAKARRAEAIRLVKARESDRGLIVRAMHKRIRAVETQLKKIDPIAYAALGFVPHGFPGGFSEPPPPVPHLREHAGAHERDLWNERIRTLQRVAKLGADAAGDRLLLVGPAKFASLVAQTPAARVDSSRSSTVPVLVGWAIGLLVVLAATILVYRRRTRTTRQVSA